MENEYDLWVLDILTDAFVRETLFISAFACPFVPTVTLNVSILLSDELVLSNESVAATAPLLMPRPFIK